MEIKNLRFSQSDRQVKTGSDLQPLYRKRIMQRAGPAWVRSWEEPAETGNRIASLEKLFNLRHLCENTKDKLPEMFFISGNGISMTREDFEIMLEEYYRAMGWDKNGIPACPEEIRNITAQKDLM